MKVIRKTVFAAACLSLFSFACAEPPTSAGNVIRFEDQYWDIAYDADANITVYLGFDVVYFCSTYDLFGTEIPWMQVWKSDGTRYRNHFSGQVVAAVYAGPPDCAFILGSTPLATGVVHVRWNDNDVEPWLNPDRNNMNSVGLHANGVLFAPTGEKKPFMLRWHAMWDGVDPSSYSEIFKMKLK